MMLEYAKRLERNRVEKFVPFTFDVLLTYINEMSERNILTKQLNQAVRGVTLV